MPNSLNNKYSYVTNNPQNYIDPSGEILFTLSAIAISGIVGGAINAAFNDGDSSFGTKFWKGFTAGIVTSSLMVALPGLTAFLAVSAGASATTAFFMTLAASTIAGILSAQTTAKIVHGRNASKKELIIGGILGFGTGLFTATQVINKMSSAKSLPLRDKVILETRTQAGGATISGDYPGNSKLK